MHHERAYVPVSLSPEERSARARYAALMRWSREDPAHNAQRGQDGLREKFRREVLAEDPHVQEPELSRRANARYAAHFEKLRFLARTS